MTGRGWRIVGFLASVTITLASLALSVAMTLSSLVFDAVAAGVQVATGLATARVSPPVHYRGATRSAGEAVSDASARIQRRVAAASARSIGSAAAEALPFVGVGVIVAVTAYELQDACQLSQELRELDLAFNPEKAVDSGEICGLNAPTREEVWAAVKRSPSAVLDQAAAQYEGLADFSASDYFTWASGAAQDWFRLPNWFNSWFDPADAAGADAKAAP